MTATKRVAPSYKSDITIVDSDDELEIAKGDDTHKYMGTNAINNEKTSCKIVGGTNKADKLQK